MESLEAAMMGKVARRGSTRRKVVAHGTSPVRRMKVFTGPGDSGRKLENNEPISKGRPSRQPTRGTAMAGPRTLPPRSPWIVLRSHSSTTELLINGPSKFPDPSLAPIYRGKLPSPPILPSDHEYTSISKEIPNEIFS